MESIDLYELYKDQIEKVIQMGIPSQPFLKKELRIEADLRKMWKSRLAALADAAKGCWLKDVYLESSGVESLLASAEEMLLTDELAWAPGAKRQGIVNLRNDLDREIDKLIQNCTCHEKPKEEIKHA